MSYLPQQTRKGSNPHNSLEVKNANPSGNPDNPHPKNPKNPDNPKNPNPKNPTGNPKNPNPKPKSEPENPKDTKNPTQKRDSLKVGTNVVSSSWP